MAPREQNCRRGGAFIGIIATLALLIASAALFLASAKSSQDKKDSSDEKTIRDLIAQLGDDSFDKREEADKKLAAIGEPALELLRQAAKANSDAEVRQRAEGLMRTIAKSFFQETRRFDGHARKALPWVSRVVLTPDGGQMISSGFDYTLRCWDIASGKPVFVIEMKSNSWGLAISADGKRLIAGGEAKVVGVFDAKTGKEIQKLEGHTAAVWGAALTADGKQAVTGAWDQSLRHWDVETGKEIRAFEGVRDNVRCLALSPDGKLVAAGHSSKEGAPGILRIWDLQSGKEVRAGEGHTLVISSVAFSPNGKTILTSSFDRSLRLWDVVTGKELKKIMGHISRIEFAAFTPDGKRIVSCGHEEDPVIRIWDVATGQQLLQSEDIPGGFLGLAVLPDGRQCVTAGRDGVVRLWRWTR
jgi:WD40 repeat protein